MSGVSRFKICLFELGDGSLTAEERDRIRKTLRTEAERLRSISVNFQIEELSGATASLEGG
jgi:hypothetical protein